jgi:uncharacterized protein (TIGR01777 family)
MHVVIAGGTGAIGRRLVDNLIENGHLVTVVSRRPFKPAILPAKINFANWDGKTAKGWGHVVEEADAIVNLAGAGIADGRWTEERKKVILESRINAGKAIVEAIGAAENKPKVLIQASAVGYYGAKNGTTFTESSPAGDDFLADVCKQWEASTEAVEAMGVRRVVIRTGVVLDPKGGALPKMVTPFRFFAGGPIGGGLQWFPWIHYSDEVEAIRFLIENDSISGPVNLTAPAPLRNRDFAYAMGEAMRRPAFLPTPSVVFKAAFGEMSTVLLDGQQAVPERLTEAGYEFKFANAKSALQDLLQ